DGTRVYVANGNDATVSVIDTATNTVTTTIPVGSGPTGVAVTPDGTRVYVANGNDATVSVIDTATNTVTTTIPVGNVPIGVAVTPDGTRVYVTNINDATVSVIDTATNTVTTTIPVGDGPQELAVTPDGTRVYVANSDSGDVSVIDTATNTVTTTIPVGNAPIGVAGTPDGTRVYVTNFNDATVSVIDTATNTVIGTPIPVGDGPFRLAVTPDGSRVYVTNGNDDNVSVIDTATNTVTTTIPVGNIPLGVAIGTVTTQERTPTALTLKLEKKKGKDALEALGGNHGLTLKAKLTAEGLPLGGKDITFTNAVLLCTDTTDSRGKATCKVPGKQPKEACYTATFAGDDTYEPSTATVCKKDDHGKPGPWSELLDLSDVDDLVQSSMASAGLPDRDHR
ncbi:beta-propeller fold lactonase family protein, partial [Streptomyces sp. NPDC002187]|uniref:YVTN family beta-propeller repeat protein n=1 Tax=Streptomyces sp. NPDC002187 TaxID=3364637 RepID=UPI00368CCF7C